MLNKKAFTLVEVLAILVILGIVAVITVPKVADVINDSRESYVNDTITTLEKAANIYISTLDLEEVSLPLTVTFENKVSYYQFEGEEKKEGNLLELKGGIPYNGKVVIYEDKTYEYQLYNEKTSKCIKKDITNYITSSEISLNSFGEQKKVSAGVINASSLKNGDILLLDFDISYEDLIYELDKDSGFYLEGTNLSFEKVKLSGSGFQHVTLTKKVETNLTSGSMNFVFDNYSSGNVKISNVKITKKDAQIITNGKCI